MTITNPFAIKQTEETGILKINPTPIICRTNCSGHGAITDPSSSKKFEGLQFFPLRVDKNVIYYEDEETGEVTKEQLTFVLSVLAENCRVSEITTGEEMVKLTPGTVIYLQLKRNKSLSGSTDNFLQMKRMVEESGMHMTGCVFKPAFQQCSGVIKGKPVSYARCLFNVKTATEEKHIQLLEELASLHDDKFERVLPFDNEIMEHYNALASEQVASKTLPGRPEPKALPGN